MTLERLEDRDSLHAPHGFFTRAGGVSVGIYQGLNCGPGSDDDAAAVSENRKRVAASFDLPPDHLLSVHQCHSSDVLTVDGPFLGARPKCDAMVTRTKGLALGILTADCQPVLFCDSHAQVIGAAHAGWKGALGGVLEATLSAMEQLGAKRADISAVIGPSIGAAAYEVGPEFRDGFLRVSSNYQRFFQPGQGDRFLFDLPAFGVSRLQSAGIGHARSIGRCTYSDEKRFFSYRRATHAREADYGRLISAISLP